MGDYPRWVVLVLLAACCFGCDHSHPTVSRAQSWALSSDCCTDGGETRTARFSVAATELKCSFDNSTNIDGHRESGSEDIWIYTGMRCDCLGACSYVLEFFCDGPSNPHVCAASSCPDVSQVLWCVVSNSLGTEVGCGLVGGTFDRCHARLDLADSPDGSK